MSNNISCQGDVYVTVTKPSRQSASDQDVSNSDARTATTEASNCLPVLLQSYMAEYFQKMVCDYIPIYEKTKGAALTETDAKVFLTALQQAVSSNSVIKPFNPDFSKIDQQAAIAAILAGGDCKTAGELLAKAFAGTISVDDYDSKIRLTYRDVLDEIVGELVNPPVEALSVTATATDATCAANDGVINMNATGGVAPYQFSMDGTTFQESPSFTKLEAGNYTLTVKDSKSATATGTATVKEPETYTVVPSEYLPTLRTGITDPNARTVAEGFVDVQFNEASRKTTFKLKAGFDIKPTSSGIWVLTVAGSNAEDKKYEGKYQAYFNDCDVNSFIGFYRIDPTDLVCTSDKWKEKATVKMLCKERWLPENEYAEIVKNIMIFANGYRKTEKLLDLVSFNEFTESSDMIESDDIRGYWEGQDAPFAFRRQPDEIYYADGHHSITTSNHNESDDPRKSQLHFLDSFASSKLALNPTIPNPNGIPIPNECYLKPDCVVLDEVSNATGFNYRKAKGKNAYEVLVGKMLKIKKPAGAKVTYHIDVVAHSMGFAYAQGLIEELKNASLRGSINLKFGGYYIIAPENGSAGTVNVGDWEQIWQYGSDLNRPDKGNADKMWEQDGVAPQAKVNGLDDQRAYIPKNQGIPKGFVESHSIGNYGWIFNILTPDDKGYVTPK